MKEKQLSRKELRKQRKLEKKERIQKYHQSKSHSRPVQSVKTSTQNHNTNQVRPLITKQQQKAVVKQTKIKHNKHEDNDSEDERIAMFEQKLGMKGDNRKYGKLAKKMGFDDDLFSFLDNISKKVHRDGDPNQIQNQGDSNEELGEMDDIDEEFMNDLQNFDKMDQEEEDEEIIPVKRQSTKNKKEKNKSIPEPEKSIQKQKIAEAPKIVTQQPSNIQCHKKMNSLFNKLSDGNLLYTFRQFISIFESYPKSITYSTFATLFVKFNLLIEKPLVHVMSANIVLAVGLHRVYGDKLMAQILYELSQNYLRIEKQEENLEEIEEIGYSKKFEKRKNFVTIACYLYQFSSISSNFPLSIVSYLTENIANKQNVQLIYQVVQKCGVRMRSNDPGTLKQVIQILRKMIDDSKLNGTYQTTKIKFIELEINEIRFNKKGLFDADQRMGFLRTFLSKSIKEEAPAEERTLDVTLDQFKIQQDTNGPEWWTNQQKTNTNLNENTMKPEKVREMNEEVKQLLQLAKSMHFVTEVKKNIFVQLMSSHDYIQATKKLLQLKIKRLEDLSTVLVQVNLQQSTFNPFYCLVACKIAEEIPKFRVCLQFSIWDRLKQVCSYDPRKISNLGKFTGWLVSSEEANSSLTLLKYFPDMLNVKSEEDIFLQVFFKQLFRRSSHNWIARLVSKLKEEKNKVIRDGIKDYLGQILDSFQTKKQKQNAILLRKLVAAQFQTELDND